MKTDKPTTDCRRLLRILYEVVGYPAGCRIDINPPYGGSFIPNNHLATMRLVRKEVLARQTVKSAVTEEMFTVFENVIKAGAVRNIFDLRDRINLLLNNFGSRPIEKSAEELVGTNKLRGNSLPPPVMVAAYIEIATGKVLENDRHTHFFVDHGDYLNDALSGTRYAKNRLKVARMKGQTNETITD